MDEIERRDFLMLRMGFPETERGRFVTALREETLRQVRRGLVNTSAGTWRHELEGGPAPSHEERARAILAMWWEIDHGHANRVENLDGDDWWAAIGDRLRRLAADARRLWGRARGRKNPWSRK